MLYYMPSNTRSKSRSGSRSGSVSRGHRASQRELLSAIVNGRTLTRGAAASSNAIALRRDTQHRLNKKTQNAEWNKGQRKKQIPKGYSGTIARSALTLAALGAAAYGARPKTPVPEPLTFGGPQAQGWLKGCETSNNPQKCRKLLPPEMKKHPFSPQPTAHKVRNAKKRHNARKLTNQLANQRRTMNAQTKKSGRHGNTGKSGRQNKTKKGK
jgi:hypothetical protein